MTQSPIAGDVVHVPTRRLPITIGWEIASLPGIPRRGRQRILSTAVDAAAVLLTAAGTEVAWSPDPLAAGGAVRLTTSVDRSVTCVLDAEGLPAEAAVALALRSPGGFWSVCESWLRWDGGDFDCACLGGHEGVLMAIARPCRGEWDLVLRGEPAPAPSWTALARHRAGPGAGADALVHAAACA